MSPKERGELLGKSSMTLVGHLNRHFSEAEHFNPGVDRAKYFAHLLIHLTLSENEDLGGDGVYMRGSTARTFLLDQPPLRGSARLSLQVEQALGVDPEGRYAGLLQPLVDGSLDFDTKCGFPLGSWGDRILNCLDADGVWRRTEDGRTRVDQGEVGTKIPFGRGFYLNWCFVGRVPTNPRRNMIGFGLSVDPAGQPLVPHEGERTFLFHFGEDALAQVAMAMADQRVGVTFSRQDVQVQYTRLGEDGAKMGPIYLIKNEADVEALRSPNRFPPYEVMQAWSDDHFLELLFRSLRIDMMHPWFYKDGEIENFGHEIAWNLDALYPWMETQSLLDVRRRLQDVDPDRISQKAQGIVFQEFMVAGSANPVGVAWFMRDLPEMGQLMPGFAKMGFDDWEAVIRSPEISRRPGEKTRVPDFDVRKELLAQIKEGVDFNNLGLLGMAIKRAGKMEDSKRDWPWNVLGDLLQIRQEQIGKLESSDCSVPAGLDLNRVDRRLLTEALGAGQRGVMSLGGTAWKELKLRGLVKSRFLRGTGGEIVETIIATLDCRPGVVSRPETEARWQGLEARLGQELAQPTPVINKLRHKLEMMGLGDDETILASLNFDEWRDCFSFSLSSAFTKKVAQAMFDFHHPLEEVV